MGNTVPSRSNSTAEQSIVGIDGCSKVVFAVKEGKDLFKVGVVFLDIDSRSTCPDAALRSCVHVTPADDSIW